jgi:mannose-6-phosphate isomerase-like protein (cupin superfamily)
MSDEAMTDSEPKEFLLAGVVMKRLISGDQTEGQFCLFENRSNGQTRTPIHVHADDDETVYVIEGQLTALVDGEPRILSPGESMFLKRGIPHQLMNPSHQPVRYILIGTPSMFEQFLAEGGRELRKGEAADSRRYRAAHGGGAEVRDHADARLASKSVNGFAIADRAGH